MTRLILFLVGVLVFAAGLSWLADQPGTLVVNWKGYEIETTVFRAVVLFFFLVGLAVFLWTLLRQVWASPATVGRFFTRRRQQRGLDALSSGMIAIGAGDRALATQYAVQARKALPNEPLTHLLRAQAAQLSGDRSTSRRIFEAMLSSPDTEQLGLRGLFLEAEREGELEAAEQFAARAFALNSKLTWSFDALFDLQCKRSVWEEALETLSSGTRNGLIEKADASRRRAVLLTAQAQALEEEAADKALDLALKAHDLASDLVPAAAIAGRQLAAKGNTARVAKVIEKTWKRSPHPDLALVYAFARPGDSPRDRLERVKRLARLAPHASEGPLAIAEAAIEARAWDEARAALAPLAESRLSQRVCTLMARVEGGECANAGAVREWLARAVHAPRDPMWMADGVVSETWAPISPVTGALDAFEWKAPVESHSSQDAERMLARIEELAALGTAPTPRVAAPSRQAVDIEEPDVGPAAGMVEPVLPVEATGAGAVAPRPATREAAPRSATPVTGQKPAVGQAPIVAERPVVEEVSVAIVPARPVGETARAGKPAAGDQGVAAAIVTKAQGSGEGTPSDPARPVDAAIKPVAHTEGVSREATAPPVATQPGRGKSPTVAVFVPPRAPDDPGLEESDAAAGVRADYVPQAAKRSS